MYIVLIFHIYLKYVIQVHGLISGISQHKLLVLTGQSLEETGDLVLHTGQFTPNDFTQILSDEEVGLN